MTVNWSEQGRTKRPLPNSVAQADAQKKREHDRRLGNLERGGVQIVRGQITGSTGAIVRGEGFTCTRTAVGKYTIELNFELPSIGIMVATPSSLGCVFTLATGKKTFNVEGYNAAQTANADVNFGFTIVAS